MTPHSQRVLGQPLTCEEHTRRHRRPSHLRRLRRISRAPQGPACEAPNNTRHGAIAPFLAFSSPSCGSLRTALRHDRAWRPITGGPFCPLCPGPRFAVNSPDSTRPGLSELSVYEYTSTGAIRLSRGGTDSWAWTRRIASRDRRPAQNPRDTMQGRSQYR